MRRNALRLLRPTVLSGRVAAVQQEQLGAAPVVLTPWNLSARHSARGELLDAAQCASLIASYAATLLSMALLRHSPVDGNPVSCL
jgi:hypothetical protein